MIFKNEKYKNAIKKNLSQNLDFSALKEKCVFLTGATGLVGSTLLDTLFLADKKFGLNIKFVLLSRNRKKFEEKFSGQKNLTFLQGDAASPILFDGKIDYAIHLAALTHPRAYAENPIETIMTNFLGAKNVLDLCQKNAGSRFVNISSVEIYGENNLQKMRFSENDAGFLDCNTLRACYNESKRLAETLCQAYLSQKNVDFVTVRLCRCYGPALQKDDTKALSQFLFNALCKKDIVLKSSGEQYFSYIDSFSAANAILFAMLKGKTGQAYNVADESQDIRLKDLAALVAKIAGVKVIRDLPNKIEQAGFSKSSVALLDSTKLKALGWKAAFGIERGIKTTLSVLQEEE